MTQRNLAMLIVAFTLLVPLVASAHASQTIPWGVYRIRACCNWDNNGTKHVDMRNGVYAGQGVLVAVIDSGVYYTNEGGHVQYHPDLNANIISADCRGFSYDPIQHKMTVSTDYTDTEGHGTEVAGVIAAADNDIGVIGVAPLAKIMVLKLYPSYAYFNECLAEEAAAAIDWAVSEGAQVISMSLGLDQNFTDLYTACNNAYEGGALLIAPSGNYEGNFIDHPAAYNSVIAVGAVNETCQRPDFSNYGPKLEFVAPGVNINTTFLPPDWYKTDNGTSMAAPHVAGVAAMIFSSKIDPAFDYNHDGMWENNEVRAKLRPYALNLGPPGRDDYYGYGLVNAWTPNQRPVGDINIDHIVDMTDVSIAARAYGTSPTDPLWDPRADIIIDNFIDMSDISLIASNYGKKDP
jgi:subtilisin